MSEIEVLPLQNGQTYLSVLIENLDTISSAPDDFNSSQLIPLVLKIDKTWDVLERLLICEQIIQQKRGEEYSENRMKILRNIENCIEMFPRKDPCRVLPLEINLIIFSFFDSVVLTNLKDVSKSWLKVLTCPYLSGSLIFDNKKYNADVLMKVLDNAFGIKKPTFLEKLKRKLKKKRTLQSQLPTIKHLSITDIEQDECLQLLSRNFRYRGKSVDELVLVLEEHPYARHEFFYELMPTKKLLIDTGHSHSSLDLDRLLYSQRSLEELDLYALTDSLDLGKPVELVDCALKVANIHTFVLKESTMFRLSRFSNLKHLSLEFCWFNMVNFFRAFRDSRLESLALSDRNGRDFAFPMIEQNTMIYWPKYLSSLTLHRVCWTNWGTLFGGLSGLKALDFTESKIDVDKFFQRFNCGKNLLRLDLYTLNYPVWQHCPNIRQLLIRTDNLNISELLNVCAKLEKIDIKVDQMSQENISILADYGFKKVEGTYSYARELDEQKLKIDEGFYICPHDSWRRFKYCRTCTHGLYP